MNQKTALLVLCLQIPLLSLWTEHSYGQTSSGCIVQSNNICLQTDVFSFMTTLRIPSGGFKNPVTVEFSDTQWENLNSSPWLVYALQYKFNYKIKWLDNYIDSFDISDQEVIPTIITIPKNSLNQAAQNVSGNTLNLKIQRVRFSTRPGGNPAVPEPSSIVALMSVFGVSLGLIKKRATSSQQSACE